MNREMLRNDLPPRGQEGVALVITLFVLTVLTILGVLVLNTAIVEVRMSANQKISAQVYYAAEAGLERGLKNLIEDFENDTAAGSPWSNSHWAVTGTITQTMVSGSTTFNEDLRTMDMYRNSPSVRILSFPSGQTVNNATYTIYLYTPSATEAYVMSYATGLGGVAGVEYHLVVEDFSPYNNAIFTGAGITGHFLGSVNVAGSVYSHGNMSPEGNVGLHNYYKNISANLAAILPAETDLDAKIRVKGGNLTLSGSAQIGDSSANGEVAGVYVDGAVDWGGMTNYYGEFSTKVPDVPLPTILDGLNGEFGKAWVDGCIASQGYTGTDAQKAQEVYKDWIQGVDCFSAQPTTGFVYNGNLDITNATNNFSYVDARGNGITYDKASRTLRVQGNVVITGNFSVGDQNTEYKYLATGADTGSGSDPEGGAVLQVGGNTTINGTFSPPTTSGYCKGGADTNSLGVVTAGDVTFTGKPGMRYVGFYYAQGQVNFNKQAQFGGTVIANVVNWGQVPDVYQVPDLKNYLPPGMPGSNTILVFTTREWRRVY